MEVPATNTAPSKDVPWSIPDISTIDPSFRDLMENYSKIPSDSIKSHILNIREKAWQTYPYPCIGELNFLTLSIASHACYTHILSSLSDATSSSSTSLLDLGCCFGQDIRKLVHDGAPSSSLSACDLEYGFIELGFDD